MFALPKTDQQFGTITPQELRDRIERGESLVILDVRQPDEYHEAHIAGSTLIPLDMIAYRHDELPQDRPIIAVCRSGNRSGVACSMLARGGFASVSNLVGGIEAWQHQGLPVERGA